MTTSGTADAVIRVTFLTRLVVLALCSVGLVVSLGSPGTTEIGLALLFCVLAVTSFLGLTGRGLAFVVRHPTVALLDVLLVVAALQAVGGTSGVVLLGIGSALLTGVLLPARVSAPLNLLLVAGYLSAVLQSPGGADAAFLALVGLPLVFVSLTAVGGAVRTSSAAEQRANAELLEVRAVAAAAEERLRLARDLHDVVGKSVQGVALHAQLLPRMVDRDRAGMDEQARRVVDAADEAVRSVRRVMAGMRAPRPDTLQPHPTRADGELADGEPADGDLADGDLADAVAQAVDGWRRETGRAVTLTAEDGAGPCDAGLRAELLAVLHEALENVRRHAPEGGVRVALRRDRDGVLLEVQDRGPGIDPHLATTAPARGHFGLVGMHERVAGLGGRLLTDATPGGGTTVRARVPARPDGRPVAVPDRTTAGSPHPGLTTEVTS